VTDLDLGRLKGVAEEAAARGGRIVAERFGRPIDGLERKGIGDYVTDADRESEETILAYLREATPDIPVVAEEEAGDAQRQERYWSVDPLDGTRNFSIGLPIVAVSVALVDGARPVVGAVVGPMLGLSFSAVRGGGAYEGRRRLGVSARRPDQAIVATGFPFRDPTLLDGYLPTFEAVLRASEDIRRAGAAALDLAWVAKGVYDGFFELNLSEWDVAAGALLVEEAGGVVTDWAGGDGYLRGDILAASPWTHPLLLEAASLSPHAGRSRN
jgi:myo-inositol-1(or 4)-monophosphatase